MVASAGGFGEGGEVASMNMTFTLNDLDVLEYGVVDFLFACRADLQGMASYLL